MATAAAIARPSIGPQYGWASSRNPAAQVLTSAAVLRLVTTRIFGSMAAAGMVGSLSRMPPAGIQPATGRVSWRRVGDTSIAATTPCSPSSLAAMALTLIRPASLGFATSEIDCCAFAARVPFQRRAASTPAPLACSRASTWTSLRRARMLARSVARSPANTRAGPSLRTSIGSEALTVASVSVNASASSFAQARMRQRVRLSGNRMSNDRSAPGFITMSDCQNGDSEMVRRKAAELETSDAIRPRERSIPTAISNRSAGLGVDPDMTFVSRPSPSANW